MLVEKCIKLQEEAKNIKDDTTAKRNIKQYQINYFD